jgi:hypothetical protein
VCVCLCVCVCPSIVHCNWPMLLRPFKSDAIGQSLRKSVADMLHALSNGYEVILEEFLPCLALELDLPEDACGADAANAIGSVKSWFKKPKYAGRLFFEKQRPVPNCYCAKTLSHRVTLTIDWGFSKLFSLD